MDLALSDEQRALVDSFSALLAKSSSPDRVRAAEPGGFDADLWRTLGDVGAITMAVPEDLGGWGADTVDLALVAEQLGRAAAPAPLIESQVTARLLARCSPPVTTDVLAPVVDGDSIATLALHPSVGGACGLVPAGAICDRVVVLDQGVLRQLPVTDAQRRRVDNLASAPLADLQLSHGDGSGAEVLAEGDEAVERYEVAIDEWMVLTAAALVGLGSLALEQACAYAAERHAFGSPIGAFQGVAHPLADDATDLDGARLLTLKAAWSLDRGDERARELAAMAFANASEVAQKATYDAIHTHGGYGFMLEHDVQLFYRRARGWPRVWGDVTRANRRVADARYRRLR